MKNLNGLLCLWFVIFVNNIAQTKSEFVLNNLQDFCNVFEIRGDNCTCTNDEIRKVLAVFPKVCERTEKLSNNQSSNHTEIQVIHEAKYSKLYAGIVSLISVFGITGNLLVIIVAVKNRKTAITYQKLIGQLAFWDLTFACLQLATVLHLFWTNTWIYGEGMCKFLHSSLTVGSLLAVGLILIITIERYLAITHPLVWRNGTKNLGYILSVINAIAAIASVIPRAMYLHITDDLSCFESWPLHRSAFIYQMYLLVVYFAIPIIAIFCLHVHIMYTLRNERFTTQSQLDIRVKSMNRRIMYVLISVVIAFVILVLPNRSIMLYFAAVKNEVYGDAYTALAFIALLPYSFHVAVNPILYSAVDKAWRKQTIEMIKQVFRTKAQSKRKSTMSTHASQSCTMEGKLRTYSVKDSMVRTGSPHLPRSRGNSDAYGSSPGTNSLYPQVIGSSPAYDREYTESLLNSDFLHPSMYTSSCDRETML